MLPLKSLNFCDSTLDLTKACSLMYPVLICKYFFLP